MLAPEIPDNEPLRLASVNDLNLLDREPEERFDRLTRLAKRLFGVPIAGCVFALEVQAVGRMRYDALLPALSASLIGDLVVRAVGVKHTVQPQLGEIHITLRSLPRWRLPVLRSGWRASCSPS